MKKVATVEKSKTIRKFKVDKTYFKLATNKRKLNKFNRFRRFKRYGKFRRYNRFNKYKRYNRYNFRRLKKKKILTRIQFAKLKLRELIRTNRKEEKQLLEGPFRIASSFGEKIYKKKGKRFNRRKKIYLRQLSSKATLNLFRLTYNTLLNYHCPFGKRTGEWKPSIQLTNVLLIRNEISILNISSMFFELRKAINRLFKAFKLRKGVAILNGRRYGWRRTFTFWFEKWLPGFFTNFWLNINELISYFYKSRCLTRRQKTRIIYLKMFNLDARFLKKKKRKKKRKQKIKNLISFIKLPTVSVSLLDNNCWLRECLKEGISTIQLADSSSDIQNIEYPVVSNQSSVAFISFISLLSKEIAYQARYWEIKKFKKSNYYKLSNVDTTSKKFERFQELAAKWLNRYEKFRKIASRLRPSRRKIRSNRRRTIRRKATYIMLKKKVSSTPGLKQKFKMKHEKKKAKVEMKKNRMSNVLNKVFKPEFYNNFDFEFYKYNKRIMQINSSMNSYYNNSRTKNYYANNNRNRYNQNQRFNRKKFFNKK